MFDIAPVLRRENVAREEKLSYFIMAFSPLNYLRIRKINQLAIPLLRHCHQGGYIFYTLTSIKGKLQPPQPAALQAHFLCMRQWPINMGLTQCESEIFP